MPNASDGQAGDDSRSPVEGGIHERPVDILRYLVQFDTTNPPGDERACIEWIADVLAEYGVDSETYATDPDRPNLVARLVGGDADPLLLYGHVDVVPADADEWTHPPFEGVVEDGSVWGRGTLDMKGGVAMMLAAFLRAAHEDVALAGDLVFCALADEEAGGDVGAGFMADHHPEVFEDVEYAIGEFGGFTLDIAGKRFFPIQVAEKQVCWLELTFTGPGGHGSRPTQDDAMARMASAVDALNGTSLPVHVTPPAREMFGALAAELSPPKSWLVRSLLRPPLTQGLLGLVSRFGDEDVSFGPMFRNTVNATVVRGGDKENVVPSTVSLTLDVRVLPGYDVDDAIREVREVIGDGPDIDVIRFEEGPSAPDMGLFDHFAGVLETADPVGSAIPMLLPASSDARHFSKLGIQTYGFTPLRLPSEFDFNDAAHAPDERVPVDAIEWGTERMYEAVAGYEGV